VFKAVPKKEVPKNAKILTTTWVMKKKLSGRYRARMNMRGYEQVDGKHYDSASISAPVTNDISIQTVMVLMLMAGWAAAMTDVKGAFLIGEFENGEEMYAQVPQGFEHKWDPNIFVLFLLCTVYGTK
jgi:hypothetical protein